jgi:hypothetical protein
MATTSTTLDHLPAAPQADRADRWLLVGVLLCAALVPGPIGLIVIAYSLVLLNRARAGGELVRPMAVTIWGLFAMVDAFMNTIGWSMELFSHDTKLLGRMTTSFGRMIDAGYYLHYDSTWMGGVFDDGEKSLALIGVFLVFPARAVAAWGFIKLKRWGFRWMIITGWGYVCLWGAYIANQLQNFPDRMGGSLYGVTGWWIFNIFYMTPFLTLPWLYALNRQKWNR